MRFMVKQKVFSLGDKFNVFDEDERLAYFVEGKFFSWGDQLSFQDAGGTELARISQKMLTLMPKYEIHQGGVLFAEVVKEFSWFKSKFKLDVPGPNDYTIEGSFWEHEYSFERRGRTVASVSKQYFSFGDTYGIDIDDEEDVVSILATVVVIDLVLHDGNDD